MNDEAEVGKSPSKIDHQTGKARVLIDDITYLMMRSQSHSLASIAEHVEIQEEIHDLQRILSDWESHLGSEIAKMAAELSEASLEKIRAIVREEIAKVLHPEPEISDYDESLD